MNSDDKNNNKNIINIKNSVFLNTKKNDLKKNLDFEKIVIVVYEIMENILYLEYDIDYLIIINYDSKNNSFVDSYGFIFSFELIGSNYPLSISICS